MCINHVQDEQQVRIKRTERYVWKNSPYGHEVIGVRTSACPKLTYFGSEIDGLVTFPRNFDPQWNPFQHFIEFVFVETKQMFHSGASIRHLHAEKLWPAKEKEKGKKKMKKTIMLIFFHACRCIINVCHAHVSTCHPSRDLLCLHTHIHSFSPPPRTRGQMQDHPRHTRDMQTHTPHTEIKKTKIQIKIETKFYDLW